MDRNIDGVVLNERLRNDGLMYDDDEMAVNGSGEYDEDLWRQLEEEENRREESDISDEIDRMEREMERKRREEKHEREQ